MSLYIEFIYRLTVAPLFPAGCSHPNVVLGTPPQRLVLWGFAELLLGLVGSICLCNPGTPCLLTSRALRFSLSRRGAVDMPKVPVPYIDETWRCP